MPENIKKVQNPSGKEIFFSEDDHKYFDEDGNTYYSTTNVVHSLFPEFEKDKIAYFCARKRLFNEGEWENKSDIPEEDCLEMKKTILNEWEEKGDEASQLGTDIHKFAECQFTNETCNIDMNTKRKKKMIERVKEFISDLSNHYEFLEAEKIIFSPIYKLSGTVDLIMKNRSTNNLCIFDWKTNKAIQKTGQYDKKGKLFLSEFDDCNYWKYCLQLNIYKWIMNYEKYGDFENSELGLFHINTKRVTPIQLPHLDIYKDAFFDYVKNLKGK